MKQINNTSNTIYTYIVLSMIIITFLYLYISQSLQDNRYTTLILFSTLAIPSIIDKIKNVIKIDSKEEKSLLL